MGQCHCTCRQHSSSIRANVDPPQAKKRWLLDDHGFLRPWDSKLSGKKLMKQFTKMSKREEAENRFWKGVCSSPEAVQTWIRSNKRKAFNRISRGVSQGVRVELWYSCSHANQLQKGILIVESKEIIFLIHWLQRNLACWDLFLTNSCWKTKLQARDKSTLMLWGQCLNIAGLEKEPQASIHCNGFSMLLRFVLVRRQATFKAWTWLYRWFWWIWVVTKNSHFGPVLHTWNTSRCDNSMKMGWFLCKQRWRNLTD